MSEYPLQLTFGARQRAFLTAASDFQKQRTRVTRRVHRTRRHLKIQQKDTHKYTAKPITSEEYASSYKYYTLGLMNAEKDFLYALELRAQTDAENSHAKQKLLVTRLKRALQRSTELVEASTAESDKRKRLELLIYTELIRAYCAVASKKWGKAIDAYSISRCALQFLENHGPSENKIVYKDIIEENIDESLKLAIYRETKDATFDLTEFTKKVVQTKFTQHEIYTIISSFEDGEEYLKSTDESELVKEISWRDYTARVKDETTSRLLSRANNTELGALSAYDDKMLLLQEAIENHQSYISRTDQDDEDQDDQILLAYLQYCHLLTRAQRDHSLLANASKKEQLRILDTIKTTIRQVEELPGVYSDDVLFGNLEFVVKYFESHKLNMFAEVFAQSREYTKALSLSTESLTTLESIDLTIDFEGVVSKSDVESLTTNTRASQRTYHVLSQLAINNKNKSVADDLSHFATTHKNLVSLDVEQIQSKPVLFDVAFNYVSYPPSSQRVSRESTPAQDGETPKKKKGLFGFFG